MQGTGEGDIVEGHDDIGGQQRKVGSASSGSRGGDCQEE